MRRKGKYGVETNHTIRRCFCYYSYCQACKSVCKISNACKTDPESLSQNHLKKGSKKVKIYQIGFGSLLPGKKFVFFDKKSHRRNSSFYFKDLDSKQKRYKRVEELHAWLGEMDLEIKLQYLTKKHKNT